MKDYFNSLISKGKPVHAARHMVARKIAELALAIMKSGKQYNSTEVRKYVGGREVDLAG
jgi:glucose-6-phosphate isomerase